MAKIGLKYPRYCLLIGEAESLGTGKDFAKAIKANISIATSDAKMYANDGLAENIKEFVNGTLTSETDDIEDAVLADVVGHTFDDGELIANGDDVGQFVRFAFLVRKIKNHVVYYVATVLQRVQFAIPDEEFETKGENTAFKSSTITGTIYRDKDGNWKKRKTFTSEAAALAYINAAVNYAALDALALTVAEGTTENTITVTASPELTAGNSYVYKIGYGLQIPTLDSICSAGTGYTAWDGETDIAAISGVEIVIVEVDGDNKAKKAGTAIVVTT